MMDLRFVWLSFQVVAMLRGLRVIGRQARIPGIDSNVSRLNNSVYELVAQHQAFCSQSSAKDIANPDYAQTKVQFARMQFLEQLRDRLSALYSEVVSVKVARGQSRTDIQKNKMLAFLLDPQWVASIQEGYKFTPDAATMTRWAKVSRRMAVEELLCAEVLRVIPSCQEFGEWKTYYNMLDLKEVLPAMTVEKPAKIKKAVSKEASTKLPTLSDADLTITVTLCRELITRHPAFIEVRSMFLAKPTGEKAWKKLEATLLEPVVVPYSKSNLMEEVVLQKIELAQKEMNKFIKTQKDEQKAELLRALRPHVAQLRELKKDPKAWQEFIQEI